MKRLEEVVRGHMPSLDGLRGIAILAVLGHNFELDHEPWSIFGAVAGRVVDWGWVGVQLFFVLSGFLITGILLDSKNSNGYYRSFFARRVLRIFPIYYLTLFAAFVVIPLVTGKQPDGHEHQLWLWLYLTNWAAPFGKAVSAFPHFWSLAVEEQFYLVWPIVVRRLRQSTLLIVCVALAGVALITRLVLRANGFHAIGPYEFTVCRQDALVFGAAAAILLRHPRAADWIDRGASGLAWGAGALFVAGGIVTHGYPRVGLMTQTFGYSLLAWVFTVLVVLAVRSEAHGGWLGRALGFAPLRSIGKYSYAMYIFHSPLHQFVFEPLVQRLHPGPITTRFSLLYFAALSAVTYVVALLSYHLIEKHFLAMKRRFPTEMAKAA
jgi:peptidoglycan/LPS O-acetylase OafA/YrhL